MVVKKAASKKKPVDDDDDFDFPETWNPVEGEEGETLSGTITAKESGIETEYSNNAKVVTITEPDGTERNVWMLTMLKSKLWKKYEEGDDVSIRFDGMKKRMKLFTVVAGLDGFEEEDEEEEDEEEDE